MNQHTAHFRFYAELNDFLPLEKRQRTITYHFNGNPSIKDAIEALGVPHTEVDLILIDGEAAGFERHLHEGTYISVYPVFESLDISHMSELRKQPLRHTTFILDVHLGKLAKLLRMLGFDTLYRNDYADQQIIEISVRENRVILTRDRGILKTGAVTHGYWIRADKPLEQLREVLDRFDLYSQINPLSRCILCNGRIAPVDKEKIIEHLPTDTASYFHEFFTCCTCDKIYWKGSHYKNMNKKIQKIISFDRQNKMKERPVYSLRQATNEDAPVIRELVFSILQDYGLKPDPRKTDGDLNDLELSYFQHGGVFYVLENEQQTIIGSFGLYKIDETTCELRKMYLSKFERGKGLGKMMLDHALRQATALGFQKVVLETASVLKEAIALYKSYGFQEYTPEHFSSRCNQAYYLKLDEE